MGFSVQVMSYHIYTTDGIILKRTSFGEANILLYVLTEDLGLIIASAQSARLAVSKLRPALQEYSRVSLSCIKGKNGWKITNVSGRGNVYYEAPEYSHKILARISKILLQMIAGESAHPEIFKTVKDGFDYLKKITKEEIQNFETLLVLRILFQLGYVANAGDLDKYLNSTSEWSGDLLKDVALDRVMLVSLINKALKESQL